MECFKLCPKANGFMSHKGSLSCSEWTAAIKLNTNYANLRGVPANKSDHPSQALCRKCCKEKEMPSHVLGFCDSNKLRIIARHDKVKRSIIALLEDKKFKCAEEVGCKDTEGSNRRIDIVALEPTSNKAYLIDPTIRFESKDIESKVFEEKKAIYDKCIPWFEQNFEKRNYEVIPLWFGSRGALGHQVMNLCDRLGIDKAKMVEIAENVLIDSIQIIHSHIYT